MMCGCCLKLLGCCFCCLFLILLASAAVAAYLYAVYVPRLPTYEVTKLEIKAFDLLPDLTLTSEILMTVRANNPSSKVGYIYGQNGVVSVVFNDSDVICWGEPPQFEQGRENVTMVRVDMVGRSRIGAGFRAAYEANQRDQKPVPLVVRVQMPVRVVVEEVPLREFTAFVNSSLLVDNLNPNKTANIVSSDTAFHFEL